jgi:hypothetical protein
VDEPQGGTFDVSSNLNSAYFNPQEAQKMKKFTVVLAALATMTVVGAASAQDKPMMKEGMAMHHHPMEHRMHHRMMNHRMMRHRMRHMMKKEGM